MKKEAAQVIVTCSLMSLLLAEIISERGSTRYFAVLVGSFFAIMGIVAVLFKRWFEAIDRVKLSMEEEDARSAELTLADAQSKVEHLFRGATRFSIDRSRKQNVRQDVFDALPPLVQAFFTDASCLRDTQGELVLDVEMLDRTRLPGLGNIIVIGSDGLHALVGVRQNSDEVMEIFEPGTEAQEVHRYRSIYHYLVRYAAVHARY